MSTTLPPGEAAIVTVDNMDDLCVLLPKLADEAQIGDAALFIVACAMRWRRDPEFVMSVLAWYETEHRTLNKTRVH